MSIMDEINKAPISGGIAVTASAGTGKTYSLTKKIEDCVAKGINPINMLVFTFTTDAANELKKRIGNAGSLMTVGTIHSVMLQIIREHGKKRYYVLDAGGQLRFAFDILKDLKMDFDRANRYLGAIGFAKNKFTDYYDLLENSPEFLEEFFGDKNLFSFALEYERKKEHCHKIDFDDMTLKAFEILNNNPSILDNRQERWKYIFVDEAQDLCPPQTDVIKLLARKYKNLFIVGDEKQAIYGSFRASSPEFLKNFKKEYPDATIFNLPTTYRCCDAVCKAGNKIAQYIDKTIIDTANTELGSLITLSPFVNQRDEAGDICDKAIAEFNAGRSVKILYRTNAQSLVYQQIMLQENIPFSINQNTSIFQTKEAKLALACCSLAFEYDSLIQTSKISCLMNLKPLLNNKWGLYAITRKMKEADMCPFKNENKFMDDAKTADTLMEIKYLRERFTELKTIQDVFHYVAKVVEESDENDFSDSAYDNLIGIEEFAAPCKNMQELNQFIEAISRPRLLADGERAISLSTIHGSKGLEADVVFLTGVVDGLLPHKNGEDEEELNLFYVGVTRAKSELYVSGFMQFGRNTYEKFSYTGIIAGG